MKSAMELFAWVLNAWLDPNAPQEWPQHLPKPTPDAEKQSWENFADELTLSSCGFLLLHEMAHVYFGHHKIDDSWWSIEQERDADREASHWYFRDAPDSADHLHIKRLIGTANALLMSVIRGFYTGRFEGKSHPESWNRIYNVISQIEVDRKHPVYAFLAHVLPFYRKISGETFVGDEFAEFFAGFDKFINQISNLDLLNPEQRQ